MKEVVKKNIKTKTKKWKKASSKRAIEHSKIRHTHMHIQIHAHTYANRTQKHTVSPETDRTVGRASSNTQVFQIVIPFGEDDDDDHYTSFSVYHTQHTYLSMAGNVYDCGYPSYILCSTQKLCKQNFSEKGSFHFTHSPPMRCAFLFVSLFWPGRPIPHSTSVIYGCYGRLSLLFYYVFVPLVQTLLAREQCEPTLQKTNDENKRRGRRRRRREKKTHEHTAIPCHIVCYIHFVWSFHVNVCVCVCALTNRPIVYVLSSAGCV